MLFKLCFKCTKTDKNTAFYNMIVFKSWKASGKQLYNLTDISSSDIHDDKRNYSKNLVCLYLSVDNIYQISCYAINASNGP